MLHLVDPIVSVLGQNNSGAAAGGAIIMVFGCMAALVGLAAIAFWIWTIIDVAQRDFNESSEKIVWILVIIFTGVIGSVIYLIVGRSRGTKTSGRIE